MDPFLPGLMTSPDDLSWRHATRPTHKNLVPCLLAKRKERCLTTFTSRSATCRAPWLSMVPPWSPWGGEHSGVTNPPPDPRRFLISTDWPTAPTALASQSAPVFGYASVSPVKPDCM